MSGQAAAPDLVIFDCDGVLVDSEPISLRLLLDTLAARRAGARPRGGASRAFSAASLATTREILAERLSA